MGEGEGKEREGEGGGREEGSKGCREERREGGRKSFHDPLCSVNTKLNDLYCKTSQSHYDFTSGGSDI